MCTNLATRRFCVRACGALMQHSARLLVIGASARAAAFSACRAGFDPVAYDLFADLDLQRVARCARVDSTEWPLGLVTAALHETPMPCIWTGPLENDPGLLQKLAAHHHVLGCDPDRIACVRDVKTCARVLRAAGFPTPPTRDDPPPSGTGGSWLCKPRQGCGGLGIRWFEPPRTGQAAGQGPSQSGVEYYQRYVQGRARSAVFLARHARPCEVVGWTQQLLGRPGAPFVYRGSIGPLPMTGHERVQLERLGAVLTHAFGLRGLFGVDLVVQRGRIYPIEVNPRYTASVELHEWSTGRALLLEHAHEFGLTVGTDRHAARAERPKARTFGKAIVYAPQSCRVPNRVRWGERQSGQSISTGGCTTIPRVSDLPSPGEVFTPGDPVLTLVEQAESYVACRRHLQRRLAAWSARLKRPPWRAVEAGSTQA